MDEKKLKGFIKKIFGSFRGPRELMISLGIVETDLVFPGREVFIEKAEKLIQKKGLSNDEETRTKIAILIYWHELISAEPDEWNETFKEVLINSPWVVERV